jgi:type I restriction enzyme, S subunit
MDLNNVKFTWLEDSPKHWGQKKVKHLFKYSKEKIENPEDYPILSLTMRGVKERDVSSNEGQLPDTFNGYSLLKKNQLVFNPMDLISGWVDSTHIEGIISPSYRIIEPLSNDIIIEYYRYYFQKLYKEKVLFPFGEGVHYQYRWGLGSVTLMNFPLLYPSKKEQQQIVSFLDDKTQKIDSLIQQKEKKIELLKEKRTSLINHVVTKGLDSKVEMKDSGVEWIRETPNHWKLLKLWLIIKDTQLGGNYNSSPGFEGVPLMKMGNINREVMNLKKVEYIEKNTSFDEKHILKYGDFLFNTRNSEELVGKVSLWKNELQFSLYNSNILKIDYKEEIDNHFMNYLFNSNSILSVLKMISKGTTNVSGIYYKDLSKIVVCVPGYKEQQQIVEYLDKQTEEIDTLIQLEQKKIDTLKEYRQSLISEVVTGKIRVCEEDNSLSLNSQIV